MVGATWAAALVEDRWVTVVSLDQSAYVLAQGTHLEHSEVSLEQGTELHLPIGQIAMQDTSRVEYRHMQAT